MTEETSNNLTYRLLLAIFFISVVIICLAGYFSYSTQREAVQREVTNELQAIADLKVEQMAAWRQERLGDGRAVSADRELLRTMHSVVTGRARANKKREFLMWLVDFTQASRYANAILLDSKGKEVLHYGQLYGGTAHFERIVAEVAARKTVVLRDLHADGEGGYHLGLNVPLRLPGEKDLFGVLSFAIDPEESLFPMVVRWPGPSRAGETVLVRRDGEKALYLDNRAARGKAGSRARHAVNEPDAVALKALNGSSGLIRGIDLQGRQVVAAVRALPDSQWLLVTQIPLEAINKPVRDRAIPISLAVLSLILAAGMTAAYLWRLQERRHDEARRGAELERQALATHYHLLSRSANDAILLVDQQDRIVEANDRALAMYGFSREELLGMDATTLRTVEQRRTYAEAGKLVDEQPSALNETVHVRKDGSTFPVEVSGFVIVVEGRKYHQMIIRDITQRNAARRQLENANRVYAVLTQCSHAILRATTEQELFHGVCNAAVQEGGFPLAVIVRSDRDTGDVRPEAAAGVAREYMNGIQLSARIDPFGMGVIGTAISGGKAAVSDDIEHDAQMLPWRERAGKSGLCSLVCVPIQRGGQIEFAFALYSRERAFFNAQEVRLIEEVAANTSYALGRLNEEAGRKAAEEAQRNSEERYRHLVEQSPIGMYVHTGGIVRYMNAKGMEMIGVASLKEVAGKSIDSFIHPDDRKLVWERIRILNEGGACPLIAERFLHSDGSTVHVEVSAVPIVFDGDRALFVFFVDINQRKKAEEERARIEEQLLQAQKMDSIGRLAGGVAHDFNNNLTVINGYCDMLLSSLAEGDPVRAEISHIAKAGDQAARLTRQLLTFSRRQVFSPQRIDVNELVTEAKALLGRLIGDYIRIETRLDTALPAILADPTQLHQVLMNLVINARDAMPGGGDLTISTGTTNGLEERAARTVCARPAEFVVLTVADTGLGMDEETKRHIFEPFFTTKPRGFGTGLGLSIVYGIVQQSNGWVEVQSAPGAGTEFRIMLPVVVGAATSEVELSPKAAPGHETILLVEDRDDVRLLTMAILEGLGYSVLAADSGAKALEISQRSQCEIDLLLTDVVMPGMTGAELAARLSELRPSIRVLFISGYSEAEGLEVGAVENESHLLSKPFTPSALAAKVRNVLNR